MQSLQKLALKELLKRQPLICARLWLDETLGGLADYLDVEECKECGKLTLEGDSYDILRHDELGYLALYHVTGICGECVKNHHQPIDMVKSRFKSVKDCYSCASHNFPDYAPASRECFCQSYDVIMYFSDVMIEDKESVGKFVEIFSLGEKIEEFLNVQPQHHWLLHNFPELE